MIAAWMLYALLVSVPLALAAWLLEDVVRMAGGAARFVWVAALAGAVALVAVAPLRTPAAGRLPELVRTARETGGAATAAAPSAAEAALRALGAAPEQALRAAARLGDGAAGIALAAAWLALSAGVVAVVLATVRRSRRLRRAGALASMAGATVRVVPAGGPAVIGIRRPEVVVPAWLLHAPAPEQRLVVAHESEHVRARDPLVLAAGLLAVALVPWNPAVWWMLLRLRAAVELDCDARVLRRGVERHAYGTLLIDLAGRGPRLFPGAPAMAGTPSTLERRLRAMNAKLPRHARLRATLLAALGAAALAGACETPLPTSAELQRMDVRDAEARVARLRVPAGNLTYFVDDHPATADEAHALPADRIARMDIRGGTSGNSIHIYTIEYANTPMPQGARHPASALAGPEIGTVMLRQGQSKVAFDGLVVVDGVLSDASVLRTLNDEAIASMEVIKGGAATAVYSDPRAANGVIRIVTKAAARH